MTSFTTEEKIDMIFIYGECGKNTVRALQLYEERYPHRSCPSRPAFDNLIKVFCATGSVNKRKRHRQPTAINEETETFVLACVANNPNISSRQIARQCNLSQKSVWKILKRHKLHPYHVNLHQAINLNDKENRRRFCEWATRQLQINQQFFNEVLFTDESTFTNHGVVNKHNIHYWAVDNPHWLRQVEHQRPWSVNVWCGIIGSKLIGPYFIDGTLNGQKYANFIRNELPVLLEDVPLALRTRMWLQHDGCPAHYARISCNAVNEVFPNRWIGRGGIISWPARSPDLTHLDFFLWGYLKDKVYTDVPTTPEDMKQRISNACAAISSDMLENVQQTFIQRIQKCLQENGDIYEHLLT